MKRLLPSSLLGQVMAVLALGLLTAQAISTVLLYQASEQRREAGIVNALAFRLIADETRGDAMQLRRGERRERIAPGRDPRGPGQRFRVRPERSENLPIGDHETRLVAIEDSLKEILMAQGFGPDRIVVTRRLAGNDPYVRESFERRRAQPAIDWRVRPIIVASVQQSAGQGWTTIRLPEPARPRGGLITIVMQTLVIFVVLVTLLYIVLRRITRPLAQLTERVSDFSRNPDRAVALAESGPSDTRRLIAAHNAMEARISALLDEKDVMLGAIGHDLKTPLAALRVRIESVPDETQRARMADTIEDITATLDDILTLARIGRDGSGVEAVDLGALAASVVEEFEDLGQPVTLLGASRLVAQVQVTWIKRALRNLVGNALRYAGSAEIALRQEGDWITLSVEDRGPGIPEDRIAAMMEPFTRGEASRNRATGGAGLGLTLARAIAQQHHGELVIVNREGGGLKAELRLPR